jgi:hypothetical protein
VYDAHVCSPSRPCPAAPESRPPCESEASCRAQSGPPGSVTPPATTGPLGVGNLTPSISPPVHLTDAQLLARALKVCRKLHGRRRVVCERRARRRYPVGRAHRGAVRRAGRGSGHRSSKEHAR